ncbi:MAG: DUF1365 family protein [Gammaproteobacteria bacterium]|nr:DUF1365 family protein [Gammaproteobacteria bacterium]
MTANKNEYPFSRETFLQWRNPRFGTENPTLFGNPVWSYLAKTQEYSGIADEAFDVGDPLEIGPCWCNDRFGQSITELADGRTIYIGGEHEDFYDPQFYIYNDVIVKKPDGTHQIFGYPKSIFLPTDSHTATPYENTIVIIGSLGYAEGRRVGDIDVMSLDLTTYTIQKLETTGDLPGWLFHHDAWLMENGHTIQVLNGTLLLEDEAIDNHDIFQLDLNTLVWRKIRSQTPSSFSIFYDKIKYKSSQNFIEFTKLPFTGLSLTTHNHSISYLDTISFFINDVRVHLRDNYDQVKVTLSDTLDHEKSTLLKQHFIDTLASISVEQPEITYKKSLLHLAEVTCDESVIRLPIITFDINDFEELDDIRGLSCNRFNFLQINQSDFGGLHETNWHKWVEDIMRENHIDCQYGIEKIELSCIPHVFGCRIYPIAIWYIYFTDNCLNAVIIEHNDNKGNRHHYVIADEIYLSEKKGNTNSSGSLPHSYVNVDEYGSKGYGITQKGDVKYRVKGKQRALSNYRLYSAFGGWKNWLMILKLWIAAIFTPKTKQCSHSIIKPTEHD